MRLYALLCLFASFSSLACIPTNNLNIPENLRSEISKESFHEIINSVASLYKEEGILVYKDWSDGTVNAYAESVMTEKSVNFFGGLARFEGMTPDAFALVVCHEYGHHLGGAPKKNQTYSRWASTEGQSDYFAAVKCIRRYFDNVAPSYDILEVVVPERITEKCNDDLHCLRGAIAGEELTRAFTQLENIFGGLNQEMPSLLTPDETIVEKSINLTYPSNQCRLDTFVEGMLCDVSPFSKISDLFPHIGFCNEGSLGARPKCWFKEN